MTHEPEHDDLYDAMRHDLRMIAFVGDAKADRLAKVADEYADRRVEQMLSLLSRHRRDSRTEPSDTYLTTDEVRQLIRQRADRIDPDVETEDK